MSKRKRNQPEKPEIEKESDYYQLKTDAVRDLVTADESNSPEVSQAELRKYKSGPKLQVADWVKLCFIKGWFAGAVCFFFLWGLGGYLADTLDALFVTGMALGIVTDLLTNNVLRFIAKTKGGNDRWMMCPQTGYISFPLNIIYSYVVLFLVILIYTGINTALVAITKAPAGSVPLGVEPVLFGVFCLGVDLLLIQIKHWIVDLVRGGAKKSVQ